MRPMINSATSAVHRRQSRWVTRWPPALGPALTRANCFGSKPAPRRSGQSHADDQKLDDRQRQRQDGDHHHHAARRGRYRPSARQGRTAPARYPPSGRPTMAAPVLHRRATSATSIHAIWDDRFSTPRPDDRVLAAPDDRLFPDPDDRLVPERDGWIFPERNGSGDAGVPLSRSSNDRRHANRGAPNQNAGALRSWSCRTLKLLRL